MKKKRVMCKYCQVRLRPDGICTFASSHPTGDTHRGRRSAGVPDPGPRSGDEPAPGRLRDVVREALKKIDPDYAERSSAYSDRSKKSWATRRRWPRRAGKK